MKDFLKILIIEDNSGDALLIRLALEESAFHDAELHVAASLKDATAFTGKGISLILSDLGLPDSEGLDTVRSVLKLFPTSAVIVLTGLEDEDMAIETIRQGALNYIHKGSIHPLALSKTIRFSLEHHNTIQQLRATERELVQSNFFLEKAQHVARMGSWVLDLVANTMEWSAEACSLFGLEHTRDIHKPATFFSLVHPDDIIGFNRKMRDAIEQKTSFGITHRILHTSGMMRWVHTSAEIVLDQREHNYKIVGSVTDITESKEAEERLEASERRHRALVEHNDSIIAVTDASFTTVYRSPSAERITGWTAAERDAKDNFDVIHPNDHLKTAQVMKLALANAGRPYPLTQRVRHKNGHYIYLEGVITNLLHEPAIGGIVNNFRDVTERKIAEEKILKSNRLYAFTSQINQTIVHIKNEAGLFDKACNIAADTGKFKIAWVGMLHEETQCVELIREHGIDNKDLDIFKQIPCKKNEGLQGYVFESGSNYISNNLQADANWKKWKSFALEYGINACMVLPLKIDGQVMGTYNLYATEAGFFDAEEISLLEEVARDVSFALQVIRNERRRKVTEESLRRSEENLRAAFDIADNAYILFDTSLRVVSFNHLAAEFTRIDLAHNLANGDYAIDKFPKERQPVLEAAMKSAISGAKIQYEIDYAKPDGSVNWYDVRFYPVSNSATNVFGVLMALADITARKRSELERTRITNDLIQRNKDLEQYAYIVSHNLRAPVANIIGFTTALSENGLSSELHQEFMNGLAISSARLDEVIMDLNHILQAGREINEHREVINLAALVDEIKSGIDTLIKKEQVSVTCNFAAVEEITSIRSYLYSIFYNLITNSIKYRQPGVAPCIRIASQRAGDTAMIQFIDNGMGIDLSANSDKIFGLYKRFHPFIEGKGIGLFMTRTQVEALGGKISVSSEVDKGTCFTIELKI